jgi:hypothetical protein
VAIYSFPAAGSLYLSSNFEDRDPRSHLSIGYAVIHVSFLQWVTKSLSKDLGGNRPMSRVFSSKRRIVDCLIVL